MTLIHAPASPDAQTSRYFAWSAFAAPLLVATGFAMVATVPVSMIAYGALRDRHARGLRWWSAPLVGLFAVAFGGWAHRADLTISLTSTLHPTMAGAIIASALALTAKILLRRRQPVGSAES